MSWTSPPEPRQDERTLSHDRRRSFRKRPQDQLVVLGRLDLAQHLSDLPVRTNDERRALVPKEAAPVETLGPPNPAALRNSVILIGQQGEVQPLPVMELLDLRDRIRRDPEDNRTSLLVVQPVIAHTARLRRTTWGSCLRVEVDDDRLAAEVRELHRPTVLVRQLEVRGLVTSFDHGFPSSEPASTPTRPTRLLPYAKSPYKETTCPGGAGSPAT